MWWIMNKKTLLLILGLFLYGNTAFAQSPIPTNLVVEGFGGRITDIMVCTATGSLLVGLTDFKSNTYLQVHYIPLVSRLNQNFMLVPGNSILGTYTPAPKPCLIGFCPFCKPYGAPRGIITSWPLSGVGTSLLPIK